MKAILLNTFKYISLPFAILYGALVALRNKMYDWKLFSSISFDLPVICVGNLTVGGTGKSPHIEYLIELLFNMYNVATLSRGYKRRTQGFILADMSSTAKEIGDEPFQFKSKYPHIEVAVAEERMTAIPLLLQKRPNIQTILLDDAFQHRTVKAGLTILLTDYDRLYTRDYIMPFGLLRESKKAAQRAEIIIITKCPSNLSEEEKSKLIEEINPTASQRVYFSCINYKDLYALNSETSLIPNKETEVLVVSGIANPKPLIDRLKTEFKKVFELKYKDHHYFTKDDIEEIEHTFKSINTTNKIIVTTEKDAARLMLHRIEIMEKQLPFFAQKIGVSFLFDDTFTFNQQIFDFIAAYYPSVEYETVFEE